MRDLLSILPRQTMELTVVLTRSTVRIQMVDTPAPFVTQSVTYVDLNTVLYCLCLAEADSASKTTIVIHNKHITWNQDSNVYSHEDKNWKNHAFQHTESLFTFIEFHIVFNFFHSLYFIATSLALPTQ